MWWTRWRSKMAAHRARWYGEKLRTSASFVSPVNSHRCVLRLPFPPLFPLPLSLLFSKRAPRHRPPSRASPVRTRVHRVYIKPSPLSRPSRFAIMPRDRPASDRASCFATNDWTTQKTVAKSPISTFIELRCSTDSPPPPPPPTFLPSSPWFLFFVPSLLVSVLLPRMSIAFQRRIRRILHVVLPFRPKGKPGRSESVEKDRWVSSEKDSSFLLLSLFIWESWEINVVDEIS